MQNEPGRNGFHNSFCNAEKTIMKNKMILFTNMNTVLESTLQSNNNAYENKNTQSK